jgi:exonuclease VII large subunit
LEAGDPEKPLQRGFAMVFHDGKLLRDARTVARGELIEARLQHGTLAARVEDARDE